MSLNMAPVSVHQYTFNPLEYDGEIYFSYNSKDPNVNGNPLSDERLMYKAYVKFALNQCKVVKVFAFQSKYAIIPDYSTSGTTGVMVIGLGKTNAGKLITGDMAKKIVGSAVDELF